MQIPNSAPTTTPMTASTTASTKGAIPTPRTVQWDDLPKISARSAALLGGLDQCAITEDGTDRINLLLPHDGLVSLIGAPEGPVSDQLMAALGRVISEHTRNATTLCRRAAEGPRDLEFHHLNPKTKKSPIAHMMWRSMAALVAEIRKCILLCRKCHREHHGADHTRPLINGGGV